MARRILVPLYGATRPGHFGTRSGQAQTTLDRTVLATPRIFDARTAFWPGRRSPLEVEWPKTDALGGMLQRMGFVTTQWLTAKGWKGPERTGHVGFVVGIVARAGRTSSR